MPHSLLKKAVCRLVRPVRGSYRNIKKESKKHEIFETTFLRSVYMHSRRLSGYLLRRLQIVIDEDSLERYGKEQGEFGKRLRNSIDWEEECFYQKNRRCAF